MPRTEVRAGVLIGCGLVVLAGCAAKVGPRDGAVAQAARVSALEAEVASLQARLAEASAIRSGDPASADEASHRRVDADFQPWPVELVDARGSGVRPTADGAVLQYRVRTQDARGRFLQTTGPADLVATAMSDDGLPVELGRWTIDRETWRDALREGLLGTTYALDLPLSSLPPEARFLLVRLTLDDFRLTEPLRLESPIPVIRPVSEVSR
jgi:hypothetical protein